MSAVSKNRLPAVDLMRGVAAFGVVLIHSGLVVHGNVTASAGPLQSFFGAFVVPFFLAAAFYFALREIQVRPDSPWLRKRTLRLLIPYAAWTAIYLTLQFVEKRMLKGDTHAALLPDPIANLFFGASGVALYFLPLVLIGFGVVALLIPWLLHRSVPTLLGLFFLSAVAAEILSRTGNAPSLSTELAFEPVLKICLGAERGLYWASFAPLRVLAVASGFALRCLPYLFIVALFSNSVSSAHSRRLCGGFSAAFLLAAAVLPVSLPESLIGSSVLCLSVLVSPLLPSSFTPVATAIGCYSFGIYLSHQLILEALKVAFASKLIAPATPFVLLGLSLVTCLVAAVGLAICQRVKWPSLRLACGI